jgi:hypothetical protein
MIFHPIRKTRSLSQLCKFADIFKAAKRGNHFNNHLELSKCKARFPGSTKKESLDLSARQAATYSSTFPAFYFVSSPEAGDEVTFDVAPDQKSGRTKAVNVRAA